MPLAKAYTLTVYGMSSLSLPSDEPVDELERNVASETENMQNEHMTAEDFLIRDIDNEEIKSSRDC